MEKIPKLRPASAFASEPAVSLGRQIKIYE